MDLARFALDKRLVSALATILILLAGWFAFTKLPRFEDPEFIIRQAQIITPYPGASALEVAEEVSDVIEDAVQQLQGLKEVKSVSSVGVSEVTVEFEIAASKTRSDLHQKFTQLRAKISDTQGELPPNAGPTIVYDDFGDVYALYYAITGEGFTLPELYEYAKSLQKEIVNVDGVSKVVFLGVPQEVIYVEYEPARLFQLGLSANRVAQLLEGQNLIVSAGTVETDSARLIVRPEAAVGSVEAIEEIRITDPTSGRSYRLGDIADVHRGLREPPQKRLYRNGEPAIGLGVSNTLGGNVVEMGAAVDARMAQLEALRPIGIEVTPISDQAESVDESIGDFIGNVLLALAIVVGTLLVFMGLRSGLLMGGILVVTVAGTLFGMYMYGLDLQRVSLGAMIIALGMLVDNAIVVVEGTLVRAQRGEDVAEAAVGVVEQTKWPLLGGTVVGLLAFSPIGFSPDNTGEYAGSLFWTVTIALLFSWLVAVWLTPWYCTLFLKADEPEEDARPNIFYRAYSAVLRLAIRIRWITIALVVALFASAILSFGAVQQGFFPNSTRPQFVIDYTLPEGSSFERTERELREIADWVRDLEGVTGTNTVIGGGHLRFMLTYNVESANPAYGQILVDVDSFERIDPLLPTIQAHIEETYLDSLPNVWKFVLGPGGGSDIEARFTGPDPVTLRELSEQAKSVLNAAGAVSVKDDWREMIRTVRPQIDEETALRLGITQADIARAIAAHFDGARVGVYREGDELRPIVMRPVEDARDDAADMRDVQVFSTASNRYVPLGQIVERYDTVAENGRVRRIDRALAITAQADAPANEPSTAFFERIRPEIEAIPLPPGYALEWRGEYGNSQDANAGLASTMPFGFGAMIVVVFLLFNAVRQPVIIWLTVPLAMIGVIYGLIALETPLEFMGILAVLSLAGMLIKNAIVLIDETDLQIREGKPRMDAVADAAVSRVRPVCLGVLTTVLGVIPLLWDPFLQSLAVVIICGLSFATVLTLIVVPVLYAIFFGVSRDEVARPEQPEESIGPEREPETAEVFIPVSTAASFEMTPSSEWHDAGTQAR